MPGESSQDASTRRGAAGNLVMADIDTAAWKENFAVVAAHGADDAALFFYSYLFLSVSRDAWHVPAAMTRQRDRLIGALVRIVTNVDKVKELLPYLQDLG